MTARQLSRILVEGGFQKANRHRRTEGFYIRRAGFWMHVRWYQSNCPWQEARVISKSKEDQMRELLFELGHISSHPRAIYIECLRS